MKRRIPSFLVLAMASTACTAEDMQPGPPGADDLWQLVSLDGAPFAARATLGFSDVASVRGQAACNSYAAPLTATWPAFGLGPVRATRMACPEAAAEDAFLSALAAMTAARLQDGQLILTAPDGHQMVFDAAQP